MVETLVNWTKEETTLLQQHYSEKGANIPFLSTRHTVASILTKANRLRLSNKKKWTPVETDFLIKNIKIMTFTELSVALGLTVDEVRYKANKLGHLSKKHKNVNEDFFKTWSEDMAYILGLWFADGNLEKDLKRFSICSIDFELLDKVKKAMQSEHPLRLNKKGSRTYTLAIGRKEMCKDIVSLGGTPRKSLTAIFPLNIPPQYREHFIRGNFDGDGSISLGYKGYPKISFLGTNDLLHGILNAVQVEGEVKKSKDANVHYLLFSGRKAQKVLHYMYHESDIYLDRKHKRYLEAMRWMKKMNGRWTKEEDEILKKNYPLKGTSIDELLTNRPRDGIRARANKLGINCELERKFWRNKL